MRTRRRLPLAAPAVAAALLLLATLDDRHVGRAPDERQVIRTAVALAETGQIGQARARDFTFTAPDGRSVSRFGMGMSLVEVPAALAAPWVERWRGPGTSQPLFLLPSVLLVLIAAVAAGRAARWLGAGPAGQRAAVILTAVGSPLGAYASTAFSEPLQAAALAVAFAAGVASAGAADGRRAVWLAAGAGAAAGMAVLAKSSLILPALAVLVPLAWSGGPRRSWRRVVAAATGAAPGLAVWAWFEIVRFGTVFGSYPGERFNHPVFDGLWRLAVGPNAGLLWFFPALGAAVWGGVLGWRSRDRHRRTVTGAPLLAFVVLWLMAAGWWAWHGVWGWGPRLLVPAVPLLSAVAAPVLSAWRAPWRYALISLSIALNLPGLLQHAVPVAAYTSNVTWPAVGREQADAVAAYARRQEPDGTWRISPDHVLSTVPSASPFLVFPWFAWAQCCAADAGAALAAPPWAAARPDLVPAERPLSAAARLALTGPPRARFWGRGFQATPDDAVYAAVYDDALTDQVIRLQQERRVADALALARDLVGLAPTGSNDALVLECHRLGGDRQAAWEYLHSLPMARRRYPAINVVLALFERDAGSAESARQLLGSVAAQFGPDAPLQRALSAPLATWPPDLPSMLAPPVFAAGQ